MTRRGEPTAVLVAVHWPGRVVLCDDPDHLPIPNRQAVAVTWREADGATVTVPLDHDRAREALRLAHEFTQTDPDPAGSPR
jgi:hypothetical protein